MEDRYLEISRGAQAEIKIKGSRFIGETCRVSSAEEASRELENIRKREFAASHYCYAWQTGLLADRQFKYSDDGEPSGTAGRPIYDAVVGNNLTNVLLVVTRYFGGTKLGTGGLARAYAEAARDVLRLSGVKERFICDSYRFHMDFPHHELFQRALRTIGGEIINSRFSDRVSLDVEIRRSRSGDLLAAFVEVCAGKGHAEKLEKD